MDRVPHAAGGRVRHRIQPGACTLPPGRPAAPNWGDLQNSAAHRAVTKSKPIPASRPPHALAPIHNPTRMTKLERKPRSLSNTHGTYGPGRNTKTPKTLAYTNLAGRVLPPGSRFGAERRVMPAHPPRWQPPQKPSDFTRTVPLGAQRRPLKYGNRFKVLPSVPAKAPIGQPGMFVVAGQVAAPVHGHWNASGHKRLVGCPG